MREALASAIPKDRKSQVREKRKFASAIPFIEAILEADQKAPRKQRHTAQRIWCRIRAELPEVEVCRSTIRRYVRQRKIELTRKPGAVRSAVLQLGARSSGGLHDSPKLLLGVGEIAKAATAILAGRGAIAKPDTKPIGKLLRLLVSRRSETAKATPFF